MKKSLLAALVAGIFLLTVGAFAGTITVSDVPDIFVADDGNPSGTIEDEFVFSQPFLFADYVSKVGGSSSNPITVSYIVLDASATIDSKLALSIEGAAHGLTTTGGQTDPTAMGTVEALDADGVLLVDYINTPPLTGSAGEYDRVIKFIGDNGDDTPGTSPEIGIFVDDEGIDHFSGEIEILFVDTFDTDAEGWVFSSILGSSTGAWGSGALNITYNNTSVYSYWRRPLSGAEPIDPLSADVLYRAIMNVTSTVTSSSTPGDLPDFRVATSLLNGASELYFLSSFLSDGSANYISPKTSPRDYNIFFEATGLPAGQTSPIVMQFEGYNWPFAGRVNLIGAAVGLNRAEVDVYSAYAVNAAGTVVHSITDAAGFNTGSGTANGWNPTTFTTGGNSGAVLAKAVGNEGLVITGNPIGSGTYIYGSWDANPSLAASLPTFSSSVLYRASFKVTTATVASATVNQPIPQVRVQTGDSHLASLANLTSNLGSANNKQLTGDELTTPDIDIWFYYDGATRTGTLEPKIFPAFELLVLPGLNIPDSAAVTLRSYELSEQLMPE